MYRNTTKHFLYWLIVFLLLWVVFLFAGVHASLAVVSAATVVPSSVFLLFCMKTRNRSNDRSISFLLPFLAGGVLSLGLLYSVQFLLFYTRLSYDLVGYPSLMKHPIFICFFSVLIPIGNSLIWYSDAFSEQCSSEKKSESDSVVFTSGRCQVVLLLEDIAFIKSQDTYTTVVSRKGTSYQSWIPISRWEQNMSSQGFVRIHRSYLVNRSMVNSVGSGFIMLLDGTRLPVSKTYKGNTALLLTKHSQQKRQQIN